MSAPRPTTPRTIIPPDVANHRSAPRDHPALRPVPPSRRSPRRFPFFIAAFLLVGGLVVAVVSTQAFISQGSFRVQDLTRRTTALQQEHGELRLEVAQLSSPERIAQEARMLGFRLPDDVHILYVPAESSLSANPPATPPKRIKPKPRPSPPRSDVHDARPSIALKGLLGKRP
jgi:cell division protein FtsL